MAERALRFFISDVEVEVEVEVGPATPEVENALGAVWGGCKRPLFPVRRRARFEVRERDGFAVLLDGEVVGRTAEAEDVLPLVDLAIYRALPRWHGEGTALLHASCVCAEGCALLLLGPSGSGKSALALAALRRGLFYLGDEHALCGGGQVWGVPRAVHFEPLPAGGPLPPWLQGAWTRYRMRGRDGLARIVPLFPPGGSVAEAPAPAATAGVVALERGAETRVEPMSPLDALAALHEAALGPARKELDALVGPGRAWRLSWRDPDEALAALVAAFTASPGPR